MSDAMASPELGGLRQRGVRPGSCRLPWGHQVVRERTEGGLVLRNGAEERTVL